jgi:hypothetical protein
MKCRITLPAPGLERDSYAATLNPPVALSAVAYVDQLDPLSAQPHNPDQGPEPTDYPHYDESGLKKLMHRLMGFDGRSAKTLATPKSSDDGQCADAEEGS